MRTMVVASVLWLTLSGSATPAAEVTASSFDWNQWRHLPLQAGGRHKPLDTLAWETLRTLCNRGKFPEPETQQRLDPVTFYLAIVFDWQGWDKPDALSAAGASESRSSYFKLHTPDRWDQAPVLRVDYLQLRESLGMESDQKYISPLELSRALIRLPESEDTRPFVIWAQKLARKEQEELTALETKSLELAGKFRAYQDHRMGRRLEVIPAQGDTTRAWVSLAMLMSAKLDDAKDPTGNMRRAQEQFREARAAFFASEPAEFNTASAAFIDTLKTMGPELGEYPSSDAMDLEVAYNRWAPFRFAWGFTLLALICLLLSAGSNWKPLYVGGCTLFTMGLLAMLVGFAMRVMISGRAPVTNMYESVIYLGLGVALFGLVFEWIHRKQYVLTAAAAVATVALILADNCPTILDPSVRPLQPVLRSNFWLVTHVMTITLSYAALALALGIGNISLGYFLVGSNNREVINGLSTFTYRAVQVGVLLLAAGTILGGVWADYAWGRFWGRDPKEVWALIALLGYLAVLHARYVGWVRPFGLAALSVICFSLVVMAWYGVNFVLGAGLHSYGFGGGGRTYVLAMVLLQFLYVGVAAARYIGSGAVGESEPARLAPVPPALPGPDPTVA